MDSDLLIITLVVFGGVLFNIWFAWSVYLFNAKASSRKRGLF